MSNYTVRQGDCISSIAHRHGFFWQTIWHHQNNAALRQKRQNPNVLYPNDVVFIPEKETKEYSCAAEKRHRFEQKGVPAVLRMIVEENNTPIANTAYVLQIDGRTYQGSTNASGLLEVSIPPTAKRGRLRVGELVYDLELGSMDPEHEIEGIQARLHNLGFYEGDIDGDFSPDTKAAVAAFQESVGMKATGELDKSTLERLLSRQDLEHNLGAQGESGGDGAGDENPEEEEIEEAVADSQDAEEAGDDELPPEVMEEMEASISK
jgi:hypothetical protein